MGNPTGKRPYKYVVSIPGKWTAFLMYLCVKSEKAWKPGLAGSTIAEQLCNALDLHYSKREVIKSIGDIKFSRISIEVDYREINELSKISINSPEGIDCAEYYFLDEGDNIRSLNNDLLAHMRQCLRDWRNSFENGELMPRRCSEIMVTEYPV